ACHRRLVRHDAVLAAAAHCHDLARLTASELFKILGFRLGHFLVSSLGFHARPHSAAGLLIVSAQTMNRKPPRSMSQPSRRASWPAIHWPIFVSVRPLILSRFHMVTSSPVAACSPCSAVVFSIFAAILLMVIVCLRGE